MRARATLARWLSLGLVIAVAGMVPVPAVAAGAESEDWPCVQRKVPTISGGMMWAGPPLGPAAERWRKAPEISALAAELALRRVPLETAQARIDRFAEGLGSERDERLTLLFAGLLDTINAERSAIIDGIERYTRKQRKLAAEIKRKTAELSTLRREKTLDQAARARAAELEQQLVWDTRVFDEREQSLTYVCEAPVILEQRLFALARQIMGHLEE